MNNYRLTRSIMWVLLTSTLLLALPGTVNATLSVSLGTDSDTVTIVDNGPGDVNPALDTIRYEDVSPVNSGWNSSGTIIYKGGASAGYHSLVSTDQGIFHTGVEPFPVDGFIIFEKAVEPLLCSPATLRGHHDGEFVKVDANGDILPPGEPLQHVSASLTGTVNNNPEDGMVFLDVPCVGRLCSSPTDDTANYLFNPEDQATEVTAEAVVLTGTIDFTVGPPDGGQGLYADGIIYHVSAVITLSCIDRVPSITTFGAFLIVLLILLLGIFSIYRLRAARAN